MLAVEPRIRSVILNVPGFDAATVRPEEDPMNFLPRPMWVAESTKWLDEQFGAVSRTK